MTNTNSNKTGSYAVTTVYRIPWDKPNKKTNKSTRKRKCKIHHEIFLKCSNLTADPYWTHIFENAANNKFPRGFMCKNGFLLHKKDRTTRRCLLPNDPEEALAICMEFFKKTGGLMSTQDRTRLEKEITSELIGKYSLEKLAWKDIKKEKVREVLINDFALRQKQKYNLDDAEYLELLTTINKGFLLKQFSNSDVIFENGKVTNITGLLYNDGGKFSIANTRKVQKTYAKKKTSYNTAKKKHSIMKTWQKYISSLNNKSKPAQSTLSNTKSVSSSGDDTNLSGQST